MKRVQRLSSARHGRRWRVLTRHDQTVYCSSLASALWWRFSK